MRLIAFNSRLTNNTALKTIENLTLPNSLTNLYVQTDLHDLSVWN
jgi:hypothetical protein